jgi:protein TonB
MVVLRVQFLENGEIGKITVVKGLPYGLTENAIDAAKRMKFEPAKKDGRAVTVLRPVEFSFSIY